MGDFLYTGYEERRKERKQKLIIEALAASSASDAGALRLALAEILAAQDGSYSYGGGCSCGGKGKKKNSTSCKGHIPETTKIARRALGLSPLPDTPMVQSFPPTKSLKPFIKRESRTS